MSDHDIELEERRSITLSQLLLAPLDAIFKAQTHAARSLVHLILTLGFPPERKEDQPDGKPLPKEEQGLPWTINVEHNDVGDDGQPVRKRLTVPALSLVPIRPLGIERAEFEMSMVVENQIKDTQVAQKNLRTARPWHLIKDPVTLWGHVGSEPGATTREAHASANAVRIKVEVSTMPMPAGLSKVLTTLNEMTAIETVAETDEESDG